MSAGRAQQLSATARALGIDPVFDHRFLWIAQEALDAALPEGWSEEVDDEGYVQVSCLRVHAMSPPPFPPTPILQEIPTPSHLLPRGADTIMRPLQAA